SATDAPAWLAMLGLPLILVGTYLGAASHGRYVASQRAMRVGEPLSPPIATRYLPWAVAAVGVASLVVAVLVLVDG
ncbi:MAG TPA: hypothetical protein VEA78_04800, partial [Acidimicrobiales bacterium]|nr:hypothetical protein [Acidimicrobiales bacterium]